MQDILMLTLYPSNAPISYTITIAHAVQRAAAANPR
ncbi:hypothetical protein BLA3211_06306 [Burkholderia aenigmatica]|uniref:Uncharacterized protein n=1 Tax=Burkholderia aenigmatica TaxID=2015348 RepID=A0A6J5JIR3_9BURK|nr:hypothetical protein BLA3211_06306 [Burkholderia aenigmatica]VWD11630.1 hypothetical protein BLA17378_05952 [Burkholderia aenigmatica]VWD17658.1 hypothetical protein BLA18628_03657 [Burkholderia aenigmatica]